MDTGPSVPRPYPASNSRGAANRKNTKEITIKRAGEIGYFYFRKGDWTEKQLLTAYALLSPEFFEGGWLYPGPPQNETPGWSPETLELLLGAL